MMRRDNSKGEKHSAEQQIEWQLEVLAAEDAKLHDVVLATYEEWALLPGWDAYTEAAAQLEKARKSLLHSATNATDGCEYNNAVVCFTSALEQVVVAAMTPACWQSSAEADALFNLA